MTAEYPLAQLVSSLGENCLLCGRGPNRITVLGPDAIVVEDCGHIFDAEEWAETLHQLGEYSGKDIDRYVRR